MNPAELIIGTHATDGHCVSTAHPGPTLAFIRKLFFPGDDILDLMMAVLVSAIARSKAPQRPSPSVAVCVCVSVSFCCLSVLPIYHILGSGSFLKKGPRPCIYGEGAVRICTILKILLTMAPGHVVMQVR